MRVFRRPMFKRGGSTSQGIMTGLVDRRRYAEGPSREEVLQKKYQKILGQADFDEWLIKSGLNAVAGKGTGRGFLADVATSVQKPTEDFFTQSGASKQIAGKLGIEQAARERAQEGDISRKRQEYQYNYFLDKAMKEDGFAGAEAERYAEYHTTGKEELRRKVGNRLGGIIDFDPNNPEEVNKRRKMLAKKIGHYFYDPRDGKYKKLVSKDGKLFWDPYDSVEDIRITEDDPSVDTKSKSKYELIDGSATGVPTDEEIVAQRFP